MVSTPPRTLIQQMNMYLGRWILKTTEVQVRIDALPKENDQSEQVEVNSENGEKTDSEQSEMENSET